MNAYGISQLPISIVFVEQSAIVAIQQAMKREEYLKKSG